MGLNLKGKIPDETFHFIFCIFNFDIFTINAYSRIAC